MIHLYITRKKKNVIHPNDNEIKSKIIRINSYENNKIKIIRKNNFIFKNKPINNKK